MMLRTLMILLLHGAAALAVEGEGWRVLFEFDTPSAATAWQAVNDGVMGGRSVGKFKLSAQGQLEFFGTLSLENNGGFASVRARGQNLDLAENDVIVVRVRGDGREYNFNLYSRRDQFSYRRSFKTRKDEWIEVELPVSKFVATWRGRRFPDQRTVPSEMTGVGILLGDKKPGPFKLEVDWIKVKPADD